MKALKGMFIYVLVLLGILIMATVFLGVAMMAFKFKVFGYGVVAHFNNNTQVVSYTPSLDADTIEIEINAKHYPVEIKGVDSEDFGVVYRDKMIGFYKNTGTTYLDGYDYTEIKTDKDGNKSSVKKNSHSPLYYDENGTLIPWTSSKDAFESVVAERATKMVINLVEPEGAIWYKECKMLINIPKDKSYSIVFNGQDGNLTIDADLSMNNLNIITKSAGVSFRTSEQLTSKEFSNLTMRTESGRFDFTNIDRVIMGSDGVLGSFEIAKSNGGKFAFKQLDAKVNIVANNVVFKADTVNTGSEGFYYSCKKGSLAIGTLNSHGDVADYVSSDEANKTYINSITADTAKVTLNNVSGDLFVVTTTGDVVIGNIIGNAVTTDGVRMTGISSIETTNGDISVENTRENAILSSEYGDITVNYYKGIRAYTKYGIMKVTNKSHLNCSAVKYDNTDYESNSLQYSTILRTADGDIKAYNILTPCEMEAENKGNIYVEMTSLYTKDASGNTMKGSEIPEAKYIFKSNKGKVDLKFKGVLTNAFLLEISAAKQSRVHGSVGSRNATEFYSTVGQVLPTEGQNENEWIGPKMYISAGSGDVYLSNPIN